MGGYNYVFVSGYITTKVLIGKYRSGHKKGGGVMGWGNGLDRQVPTSLL